MYNFIAEKGKKAYFSKENHDVSFGRSIDDALDSAQEFIAVASNPQHLNRPWPEYEWRRFHQDIRCGLKPSARMISFISGFHPVSLPGPLRYYQSIVFKDNEIEDGLSELARYLF